MVSSFKWQFYVTGKDWAFVEYNVHWQFCLNFSYIFNHLFYSILKTLVIRVLFIYFWEVLYTSLHWLRSIVSVSIVTSHSTHNWSRFFVVIINMLLESFLKNFNTLKPKFSRWFLWKDFQKVFVMLVLVILTHWRFFIFSISWLLLYGEALQRSRPTLSSTLATPVAYFSQVFLPSFLARFYYCFERAFLTPRLFCLVPFPSILAHLRLTWEQDHPIHYLPQ